MAIGPSDEFWRENINGRWGTLVVLLFIFLWHTLRHTRSTKTTTTTTTTRSSSVTPSSAHRVSASSSSSSRISNIISEADLAKLLNNLDGKYDEDVKWENVIHKTSNSLSYTAQCYKPKSGPLTYMSTTIFENCSVELLRDFYMDNEYRVKWDKTLVDHKQLQIDETNGTEIGRTVKKFPLLTPREYILAWRLWQGKDNTFYCFIKECEHNLAPLQKKYVRVGYFRSGWRIRKVPGRNACEIKMVHQEDAGLNVEMAKLVFSKGIWSYVCKMDAALRKYTPVSHPQVTTAVTLMQKVPPEVETAATISQHGSDGMLTSALIKQEKTLWRRPSKKMIAKGLLLVGGVLCISRGHSSLGTKVAIACILKKLTNKNAASGQSGSA